MRIAVDNLSKSYAQRTVLHRTNLTIADGEFVALVGASGSGKSTFLRLLSGLETPDEGQILLDGQRLRGLDPRVRMMFQEARLLPWRSVIDNVTLGLSPTEKYRGSEVLDLVRIGDRANDWPTVLSGGQRQRVALARALASNPTLLLLDEPLASLDALTRMEMQKLIEQVWELRHFGAVLVTHDCAEAAALADRALVLEDGTIRAGVPISLPRPRRRDSREFVAIEEQLLALILGRVVSDHRQQLNSTHDRAIEVTFPQEA